MEIRLLKHTKMSHSGDNRNVHPYIQRRFYTTHFWESPRYTEAGKKYFRDLLAAEVKDLEKMKKQDLVLWQLKQ
jgi:hypothetical protein